MNELSFAAPGLSEADVVALIEAANSSPTGSMLLTGGQVVWESGLTYRVSAATYIISGAQYSSAEGTITLTAADATNPRIDVIGLNTSGAIFKQDGTAAADPLKPDIDPNTQLELTFALIAALATEPTGPANTDVYLENAGTPTEWAAVGGATVNVNSTSNPRTGTKCIEWTLATTGHNVTLTAAASILMTSQEYLILFIRNKSAWASTRSIRVEFRLNAALVGQRVTIDNNLWGFSDSTTGSYQMVAIPIAVFAIPATSYVNILVISSQGTGTGLGLYIDDVVLQAGVEQPPIGMTLEEADARYVRLPDVRSLTFIIDGGGSVITAGVKGDLEIPFACTINQVTMLADQSGSIVVDIWKDTYANFPPTDADTITAAAVPTITTATKSQDTTLTGWTTAITAGNILRFNVDSCTTITRVTINLKVTRA